MDTESEVAGTDDLRATLVAAMAGSADDGADERHETTTETHEGDAPARTAVERARDASGKFASKLAETPAASTETTPPAAPAAPVETAPVAATRPAPQSWSPETRQGWGTLPPAIQDQVLKREREVSTALEQSANARRYSAAIEQVTAPHQQLLAREGVDVPTAVKNLLDFHAFFDRDPAACIAHLQGLAMQRQGRAPLPNAPAAPQRQAPQPIDVQRLIREELAQHQQQQAIASEISSFAKANPHFGSVKPAMATLIQAAHAAGQELSMQDAYDRAIWADPTIRAQLIAAQTAAAAPQPAVAQAPSASDQAKVARAKAAAGSIRGAPSGTVAKPGDRSLREELEANFHAR